VLTEDRLRQKRRRKKGKRKKDEGIEERGDEHKDTHEISKPTLTPKAEALEREGCIRLEELGLGVGEHTHLADVVPRAGAQEPGGKNVGLFELGCIISRSSVSRVSSIDSNSVPDG
jgi:hypothetical protein